MATELGGEKESLRKVFTATVRAGTSMIRFQIPPVVGHK